MAYLCNVFVQFLAVSSVLCMRVFIFCVVCKDKFFQIKNDLISSFYLKFALEISLISYECDVLNLSECDKFTL